MSNGARLTLDRLWLAERDAYRRMLKVDNFAPVQHRAEADASHRMAKGLHAAAYDLLIPEVVGHLYDTHGLEAAEDYLAKQYPDKRRAFCQGCECERHHHDGSCLICGTIFRPVITEQRISAMRNEIEQAMNRIGKSFGDVIDVVIDDHGSILLSSDKLYFSTSESDGSLVITEGDK
jgi:hypothetical protein